MKALSASFEDLFEVVLIEGQGRETRLRPA
jgi:hypothetical protein